MKTPSGFAALAAACRADGSPAVIVDLQCFLIALLSSRFLLYAGPILLLSPLPLSITALQLLSGLQDSDDEGTRVYSAATGGASRGTGSGRKRKASPVDRKPAMPQYAVKRQELQEGWNAGNESGDEDLEDIDDMGGDFDDVGV